MSKFKLVFMGTPDFAVPALQALVDAGHEVAAVYCQPPRPAGRGQAVRRAPVHERAEALGLTVRTPTSLKTQEAQDELCAFAPDVIVVAAYGMILPQVVLDMPPRGCLNIHGSLLPRWRGASPIQRAIMADDTQTGITIMRMEAGLDTGPMLLKAELPIVQTTTAQSLHDEMATLGAKLIVAALEDLGTLTPQPQPNAGVTYASKLTREESQIDWGQPAHVLHRQIRALTPWPASFFKAGEEQVKIIEATLVPTVSGKAGELLDDQLTVACGAGALRLNVVQRAGKKPVDGSSFLRGMRLEKGFIFS